MNPISTISARRVCLSALLRVCLLIGAMALPTVVLAQTTRYVSMTGTNANPATATSWATSTTNLQGAINASATGDVVFVARGLYKPGGNANTDRFISFSMKYGVGLVGGFVGNETVSSQRPAINFSNPSSTTLSGEIGNPNSTTDNSYHVFNNPSGLTTNGVLEGFVITGGRADNQFYPDNYGGGMFSSASDNGVTYGPLIVNCVFQNNYARLGGGAVYNSGYIGGSSTPRFFTCLFKNNSADQGGAIYNGEASPSFFNCSFYVNEAVLSGGAVYNDTSTPQFTNCSFQLNTVRSNTGSGYAMTSTNTFGTHNPGLTNCVLFANGGSNTLSNTGGVTVQARYSLFYNATVGYTGPGNITTIDSPFASTSDSRLWSGSSAINAGDPATTASTVGTTDLAGNPRFYNSGQVDMGAFEYQGPFCLPVSVTAQSATSVLACAGSTVTATVSATGSVTGYQWYKGTAAITGQTSATFSLTNVQPTAAGAYSVVVAGLCNSVTSAAVSLTVNTGGPVRFYVKASATGANTGLNWADAFTDLQSALRYTGCVGNLTEIWVANGIYKPTSTTDRRVSFQMLPNVAVYGGFVGTETVLSQRPAINITTPGSGSNGASQPSSATLSGQIGSPNSTTDNSFHVINNQLGLTNTAILDGFVITGGNADGGGTTDDNAGGGMLNKVVDNNTVCSPLLRNCLFAGNVGYAYGGAIYNSSSFGATSSPTLINCVFQNNSNVYGSGGAIYNESISGGIPLRAGISNPQLINCLFLNNSTQFYGGAIYNYSTSTSNSTSTSGRSSSSPQLINCSFQTNSAPYQSGGAIYNSALNGGNSSPEFINCSFQNNTASSQGGAIYSTNDGGTCTVGLTSCVFYNNGQAKTFYNQMATVLARYSLFEPSVTGYISVTGNIVTSVSPFASTTSTELWQSSPAINTGDPATTTATVGNTDLADNPRFFNNGRIDIGAFEYQGAFCQPVAVFGVSAINNLYSSSMTVCTGATAGAIVARSGAATGFQWYKGGPGQPAIALTGQTSATLLLTNAQPSDTGSYSCVVTSSCNSVTSPAFTVVVNSGPARLYVRAGATGASTGLSWADAFTDLQSALRYVGCVGSLAEIWVANGVYKPTNTTGPASRTVSFSMLPNVAIYGGFAGTETTLTQRTLTYPASTTLSGDIGTPNSTTDNSLHVISNNAGLTGTAILDGFVIMGGNANDNSTDLYGMYGGGLLNKATSTSSVCSPQIRNCLFQGNTGFYGGGAVYNYSSNGAISSPQFSNCAFLDNKGTYFSSVGGAIYNSSTDGGTSNPQLTNCSFQANSALADGWAIANNTYRSTSIIGLTNCVLFDNGGIKTIYNPTPVETFSAIVSARYSLFEPSVTGYTSGPGNLTATTSPFATTGSAELRPGSPAINAGDPATSTTTVGTTDLAGNLRFQGGRIDMGAVEYASSTGCPNRLYVRASATAGGNTGLNWGDAFTDLQVALGYANAGCPGSVNEIWVANGLYKPTGATGSGSRTVSFAMRPSVAIYGGFAGIETAIAQRPAIALTTPSGSTLSGDIGTAGNRSDNSYHVVNNPEGLTNTALLDGFVIAGGAADGQSGVFPDAQGGGMLNNAGSTVCSPMVRNCTFVANTARDGGGMYNYGSGGISSPKLTNCVFLSNTATNSAGAMFNGDFAGGTSSPQLTNCVFLNNTASIYGGAVHNYGSAGTSSPQFTNCSFLYNTARRQGGAVFNSSRDNATDNPQFVNCVFQYNSATDAGGAISGLAIEGISSPLLTNCSFLSNSATGGGAIYEYIYEGTHSPQFINCSFQNNLARGGAGGMMYISNPPSTNNRPSVNNPLLTNCVVFGNGGASSIGGNLSAVVSARYSLFDASVTGYTSITGNLTTTVSPFASTTGNQLRASFAIDAGDPTTTSATVGLIDLAGNPRFYNNGRIDMGAYEFLGGACAAGVLLSVKDGVWNDPTVWSCGAVPTVYDVVQVGHAVSIPAGYVAHLARLRYDAGGRLTWATGARLLFGL